MLLELFGRFKRPRAKTSRHNSHRIPEAKDGDPQHRPEAETLKLQGSTVDSTGFFTNASGFVMHNPQFVQNIINTRTAALELLHPHICPEAAIDSSARHPPPLCHPGTRKRIRTKLEAWLDDSKRQQNMIWLSGPAGTGKSAVAQTFAELCQERRRLGAAFFFSRSNERDDPKTVIPTLAYQLAVHFSEYKSLLTGQIALDFTILQKTPRTQLKKLIVEPLSILQLQGHRVTREPFLVLLDGLDECRGTTAQCEFVEMIGEVIRLKRDLPLLWLISSRPEPHLKYLFLRTDFTIDCDKEELLIDAETRDDVDRYVRDGFRDIQKEFWDVTPTSWPSDDQLLKILNIISGLFILASTILKYVGDIECANPMGQLVTFLSFMEGANRVGAKNPLEALDLFYSRILSGIADDIFPTTKRILACCFRWGPFYQSFGSPTTFSAQALCNFLHIDQSTFYSALRRLHSVVDVPVPENAVNTRLRFYHASFEDYLREPVRCGKFVIDTECTWTEVAKSCLFWHRIDLELFHASNNPSDGYHAHGTLPILKWISPTSSEEISSQIVRFSEQNCWVPYIYMSSTNAADLLPQLHDFHFGFVGIELRTCHFLHLVDWIWKLGPLNTTFLRTEPCNDLDLQLLDSINTEATELGPWKPATFPIAPRVYYGISEDSPGGNEYFLIGHNDRTGLFWFSYSQGGKRRILGKARFLREQLPSNHPLGCLVTSVDMNRHDVDTAIQDLY